MTGGLGLFLFSSDPAVVGQAVQAGIEGVVVDWERLGKEDRQLNADTQIGTDSVEDLIRVRCSTAARVLCRIDSFGAATAREVEQAIAAGADEILLPMVRSCEEVESVLEHVADRCGLGILVETLAAVNQAEALGRLPLSRAYVGLNDLAIERGSRSIFEAVADGTVEHLRRCFEVPFGFGGLTLPELGTPIPCRLLIGESARLGCDFSFLRRSFLRDMSGRRLAVEIPRLLEALGAARRRTPEVTGSERSELLDAIVLSRDSSAQGLHVDG